MLSGLCGGVVRRWSAVLAAGVLAAGVLVGGSAASAAVSASSGSGSAVSGSGSLTQEQALARAHASGRAVAVTGSTTPTQTVTANPDGTLSLRQYAQPVRKLVDGVWTDLDATLKTDADGGVRPAVAWGGLRLSGGGGGPLAVMSGGGMSVALSLPVALPAPSLAGATATYRDVVPGVDVVVTADTQGGFSDVVVVRDAAAAGSPLVRSLLFATQTRGVSLAADAAGNIAGTDVRGRVVLAAAAPRMWDSSVPGGSVAAVVDGAGRSVDAATGLPVSSSVAGPGEAAYRGRLAVTVSPGGIGLGLDAKLMADPGLTYPLFIDPTFSWSASAGTFGGWAVVSSGWPSTKYWKDSPSSSSDMQSGLTPTVGDVRRTLVNFTIDTAKLAGATINSAELNLQETWAWNCTAQKVDLYAPGKDLTSSNADWNDWPSSGYGSRVDQKNVAYGYNSSCGPHNVGFNVKSTVVADVSAGNKTQTFVIKADDESTTSTWKRWADASPAPSMTITYNHKPNTPTGLLTSPTTSCTGSTIGDSAVKLYASVSDPDGGTVGEDFKLWKTSDGTVVTESDPNLLYGPSGTSSVPYQIAESWFSANSAGVPTSYSWQVRAYDFYDYGSWSAVCSFTWDPTRPGAPLVTAPASATIGQKATFSVDPPVSGSTPSSYMIQLNAAAPFTVAATNGTASFDVYPTRYTDTVTVTSLSAGANVGDSAAEVFTATPAATAADADLTGDGTADLLTVGGSGIPAGLWLAAGNGSTGTTAAAATNLGAYGNGTTGDNQPSDFNTAQAITGHFTGSGLQDILYYYPAGANAGGGGVLNGNGDGSPINATFSGSQHTLSAGALSDMNGDDPLQIANAGNTAGLNQAYPDLIAISGDSYGYYLDYYPNQNGLLNYAFPTSLTTPTPGGGSDWNTWSIATAQQATGTTMFLWHHTNGDLYAWTGLHFDINTGTLTYTEQLIKTGWNTGTGTLTAADINNDGTPDVWTTTAATTTAYLITLGTTPTITPQTPQTINTAQHTWMLADHTTGTATTANDNTTTTPLPLTGTTGTTWNTGDLYNPDITLDGTTGTLTTTNPAVTTNTDFTISAWVRLGSYGGAVVSQDGNSTSDFYIYANNTDNSWRLAIADSDTTTPTWHTATAPPGSAQLGVWTHLTVSYQQATKIAILNIDSVNAASVQLTTPWAATGAFRIGSAKASSTFLKGHVADVQVFNAATITPVTTVDCSSDAAVYGINADGTLTYTLIEPATGTIAKKLVSTASIGYTPVSIAVLNNNTLFVPSTGGVLYRIDITANTDTLTFATPVALGSGWTLYKATFDGTYYYGITSAGALRRYQVTTAKPVLSDIINWSTVGTGFSGLQSFTATAPNYLIGNRSSDGLVRNYQVTSATSWTSQSPGNWGTNINSAFSPGGGLYYVRDTSNNVTLYHDPDPTALDNNPIPHITTPIGTVNDWGETMLSAQPDICH